MTYTDTLTPTDTYETLSGKTVYRWETENGCPKGKVGDGLDIWHKHHDDMDDLDSFWCVYEIVRSF